MAAALLLEANKSTIFRYAEESCLLVFVGEEQACEEYEKKQRLIEKIQKP